VLRLLGIAVVLAVPDTRSIVSNLRSIRIHAIFCDAILLAGDEAVVVKSTAALLPLADLAACRSLHGITGSLAANTAFILIFEGKA